MRGREEGEGGTRGRFSSSVCCTLPLFILDDHFMCIICVKFMKSLYHTCWAASLPAVPVVLVVVVEVRDTLFSASVDTRALVIS